MGGLCSIRIRSRNYPPDTVTDHAGLLILASHKKAQVSLSATAGGLELHWQLRSVLQQQLGAYAKLRLRDTLDSLPLLET